MSSKPEVVWRKAKSVDYYTAEVAADLLWVSAGTSNLTEFYQQWPFIESQSEITSWSLYPESDKAQCNY